MSEQSLVENKKDVVLLMDSITRLPVPTMLHRAKVVRTMTGGLDVRALEKPNRFSSARNSEEQVADGVPPLWLKQVPKWTN